MSELQGHPIGTLCVLVKPNNPNYGAVYRVTSAVRITNTIDVFTTERRIGVVAQTVEPIGFCIEGPYRRLGKVLVQEPRYLTPLTDPDAEIINERETLKEGA